MLAGSSEHLRRQTAKIVVVYDTTLFQSAFKCILSVLKILQPKSQFIPERVSFTQPFVRFYSLNKLQYLIRVGQIFK